MICYDTALKYRVEETGSSPDPNCQRGRAQTR